MTCVVLVLTCVLRVVSSLLSVPLVLCDELSPWNGPHDNQVLPSRFPVSNSFNPYITRTDSPYLFTYLYSAERWRRAALITETSSVSTTQRVPTSLRYWERMRDDVTDCVSFLLHSAVFFNDVKGKWSEGGEWFIYNPSHSYKECRATRPNFPEQKFT